jgi:hypothetical protein
LSIANARTLESTPPVIREKNERNQKSRLEKRSDMSPRGGSRPGAGRQPVRLTTLVLERRFRWQNRRHRAALFRDELDLPSDHPRAELLEQLRVAYRRQPWGGAASSLAQTFERVVQG